MSSNVLRGSESLCKLLRYLAEHTLQHPGTPPKEYQIATEVFGRPVDFDPQLDSTIRVQAGRLRSKLAEYYASEGVDDPIFVELPKGAYSLCFRHQVRTTVHAKLRTLSILLAVAGVVILLMLRQMSKVGPPREGEPAPMAFRDFWKAFVSAPEDPWVIFSNAPFVGHPETGMRYFDPARDTTRDLILDQYTGVGEVLAVHDLDGVFRLLRRQIRVKRGSLLSLDDAKNNDLIFVGSPAENLTLLDIPGTHEFVFQRLASGPRKGNLAILNVHPESGEPKDFLTSPPTIPLMEDYSVIAFVPGINPARHVMILAGITTIGTQAAVEYVCRPDTVQELLQRLGVSNTGELKPFEAVLLVKVMRGVPVETRVVAIRARNPYGTGGPPAWSRKSGTARHLH